MQNLKITLMLPRSVSFGLTLTIDRKMEALHLTRVKVTWSADGAADVVVYEGMSGLQPNDLRSIVSKIVGESLRDVEVTIARVA